MLKRQPDTELEALRHEVGRCFGSYLLWVFGFPAIVVVVVVFLILSGTLH